MPPSRRAHSLPVVLAVMVLLGALAWVPTGEPTSPRPEATHLRVNQVGYRPGDTKVALAMTGQDLGGQAFEVRTSWGAGRVFAGKVGPDRGRYGQFAHLYELDFSPLATSGRYVVRIGAAVSPVFPVAEDAYAQLLAKSLVFCRVQRCGVGPARGHAACHTQDGVAKGGPADGTRVKVDGGWHDAGDYIKFLVTTGYVTELMLATYLRHPDVFADDDRNRVPDVLEAARVGLDWILKLWDAPKGVLYYQVADASDHGTWRMPEQDKEARPVWACEAGRGANVAGKAAASLALGAVIWNDPGKPHFDTALAAQYLEAAKQIYAYGKRRPSAQPSNPAEFYNERSFADDLSLAASALFRATGDPAYRQEAREFARAAGDAPALSWSDSHALAHYELARIDPTYVPEARKHLETALEAARGFAGGDPFRVAIQRLHWGSAPDMAGVALQAFWYRDLTGDARYLLLAQQQWDYLLGANPWGVCFVGGTGTTWPRHPHHQIADLAGVELTGFWDEGPVPVAAFARQKITLSQPDGYAAFQSDGAVYHDDKKDYVTNEPTLDANATGISLTAWHVAPARAAGGDRRGPISLSTAAPLGASVDERPRPCGPRMGQ